MDRISDHLLARRVRRTIGTTIVAIVAGASGAMAQSNLVTNGSFTSLGSLNSTNSQIAAGSPSTLPGWSSTVVGTSGGIACVMIGVSNPANATPMCGTGYGTVSNAPYTYGTLTIFPGAPPGGGNVLAADSSSMYEQSISQTIGNLVVGATYTLTFQQAGAQQAGWTGNTTDQWDVTFGASTQDSTLMSLTTANDVANWASQTMIFTATATSQTLTFLASGTPASDPPFALLSDISLTKNVPEPLGFSVFSTCIAGLAGIRWLRRRSVV